MSLQENWNTNRDNSLGVDSHDALGREYRDGMTEVDKKIRIKSIVYIFITHIPQHTLYIAHDYMSPSTSVSMHASTQCIFDQVDAKDGDGRNTEGKHLSPKVQAATFSKTLTFGIFPRKVHNNHYQK